MTGTRSDERSDPLQETRPAGGLVQLTTASGVRGPVDGGWWPASDDLLREAPAACAVVTAERSSAVVRIVYDPRAWALAPRRLPLQRGYVKAGWFRSAEPQQLAFLLADGSRVVVAVVPPATPADDAAWCLAHASSPDNRLTASALLASASARSPAGG